MNINPKVKEAGQLSIFLGCSLMVIIGLLAFIVNVGLFVRAKINLQNAVDAAAYAGAATQARLLSQIGYVNWEMRNNFKEWVFKYYVLGQMGNPAITIQGTDKGTGVTNFRAPPFRIDGGAGFQPEAFDHYNFPSICIHPGGNSNVNICSVAGIPGIPRFNTVGLPAISEKHEEFLNTVVAEKAKDCSKRTDLNFGTAMIWTYGIGGGESGVVNQGFSIAADRPGVWPKAMELALRIRNLEMLVNRPPAGTLCMDPGIAGGGCVNPEDLGGSAEFDERPRKALASALRNLDGGDIPGNYDLKRTLKLTELAPQSVNYNPNSLSTYLIPSNTALGAGARVKSYLDLQLIPVNYAIFFTSFISKTSEVVGVASEGDCLTSKGAIPVPGLPSGYVKNPNMITYYAVKAEAKFIGLFFPFTNQEGVTIRAYSAAKPMGGRIGPRFFFTDANDIKPRPGTPPRSAPNVLGIKTKIEYDFGEPIPANDSFYVTLPDQSIGGIPSAASGAPRFTLPNLIYDHLGAGADDQKHEQAGTPIVILEGTPIGFTSAQWPPGCTKDGGFSSAGCNLAINPDTTKRGLFHQEQFFHFFQNIGTVGASLTADAVARGIHSVRRPTVYEAANYLIPTFSAGPASPPNESPPIILGSPTDLGGGVQVVTYRTFAPLVGPNTLFLSKSDLVTIVRDHIKDSELAVIGFLKGLEEAAAKIKAQTTHGATTATDGNSLTDAAELLYQAGSTAEPSAQSAKLSEAQGATPPCAKASLASKFGHFFNTLNDGTVCQIKPIAQNLDRYFDMITEDGSDTFMKSTYTVPASDRAMMTGYMPGNRQGASFDTALIKHPFTGQEESIAKRNYYSVKFANINSFLPSNGYFASDFFAYYEGGDISDGTVSQNNGIKPTTVGADAGQDRKNTLLPELLSEFGQLVY